MYETKTLLPYETMVFMDKLVPKLSVFFVLGHKTPFRILRNEQKVDIGI
jgi:hypothetical protein